MPLFLRFHNGVVLRMPLCHEYNPLGFHQLDLGGSIGSLTKYQAKKRHVTNMRGGWLQVPGDISGYIQDRVMGLGLDLPI